MRFYILLLNTSLYFLSFCQYIGESKNRVPDNYEILTKSTQNDETKKEAYSVLQNKCNVCHIKKNKRRVFTLKNMDKLSSDINKQVFVKKRMPKGRKNKLTVEEYNLLKKWISSIKII